MRHSNWGSWWRGSRAFGHGISFAAVLFSFVSWNLCAVADEADTSVRTHHWVLEEGFTTIQFDKDALSALNLSAGAERVNLRGKQGGRSARVLTLEAHPGSTLTVEESLEGILVTGASLRHAGSLELSTAGVTIDYDSLTIADDGLPLGDMIARSGSGRPSSGLWLRDVHINVETASREVVLTTDWVALSPGLASSLGVAGQMHQSVATIMFRGRFRQQPADDSSVTPEVSLLDFDHTNRIVAGGSVGPDVIVYSILDVRNYGSEIDPDSQERISSFSVGTTSCNIGDEPAAWIPDTNQHAVIAQNLYRLKDDRFEQIGMSWLKHGFFAVRGNACSVCIEPGGVTGEWLGVNCSDPYSASLNGTQNNLGPRSPVNAYTGFFPYPFNRVHEENNIDRRLQVRTVDVDPDLNASALYFVEGQYVLPDEAQAGNHFNNVSYRPVVPGRPSAGNNFCFMMGADVANDVCLFPTSVTRTEQSALHAWRAQDAEVQLTEVFVPGEGQFELGVKVTDMGDGYWRYEYAVHNVNSDRSAGSFRVPIPKGAIVRNLGFHAPFYHSGEPYDNAPWTPTIDTEAVIWSTTSYDMNQNANALRWGTLYNYRLEVTVPPEPTSLNIGLFKPGAPPIVSANSLGPGGIMDCNANTVSDLCDVSCEFPGCHEPCGTSDDCNANLVPDECEADCNQNGVADECDVTNQTSDDCDGNDVPDECQPDCDDDGTPDLCEEDLDADDDTVPDCDDLCPETTPAGMCSCPPIDTCCLSTGFCIPNYLRTECIAIGGMPACQSSPCRDGCLVGDWDVDGDLDLSDLSMLLECFTGFDITSQQQPSAECALRFDFDSDQDVDIDDFRRFRDDGTGPN